MKGQLLSFISNNHAFAIPLLAVMVISISIKSLKALLDFHYDYYTRKHLKRVSEILPLLENSEPYQKFAQSVIDMEAFKIASGVRTQKDKALALIYLFENNHLPLYQMRSMVRYINIDKDQNIVVTISRADKILATLSLLLSVATISYGAIVYIALMMQGYHGLIIGSLIFLAFVIATRMFSEDARRYKQAKILKDSLEEFPLSIAKAIERSTDKTPIDTSEITTQ